MLILLAAATGLRLGELLGLSVEDLSDNGLTVNVRKQAYRGRVLERLKTTNAHRVVDVHPTVAVPLIAFIGKRTGLLFPTNTGRAHNHSNVRNRMLYPVLEEMGVAQTGFHGFRRFRATAKAAGTGIAHQGVVGAQCEVVCHRPIRQVSGGHKVP